LQIISNLHAQKHANKERPDRPVPFNRVHAIEYPMPSSSPQSPPPAVTLRAIHPSDLPAIFEFQSDPRSIEMAVVFGRSRPEFDEHWTKILNNPEVIASAIIAGDTLVGHVSCFKMDGLDSVGYWIDRAYWGSGYATKGVQLLLEQVSKRPLHARVARSNSGSIRVLEKCGFQTIRYETSPDDGKFPVCQEAIMRLD